MDFSEFTKIIYSYIGNGKEYPLFIEEFFRLFIPEYDELAYNDKNPFEKMDTSTLNAYLNGSKNISKKNASFIKSNYVGTDFIDKIESLSVDAKMQLIKELRIQNDDIDALPEECNEILLKIISDIASGKKESSFTNTNAGQKDLEQKYGLRLLQECKSLCPCPNCSTSLYVKKGEESQPYFQIIQINPKKADDRFSNLLAVCQKCAQKFEIEKTPSDILLLAEIKQKLQDNEEIQEIANQQEIDTELANLINHISNATETELGNIKYNPVEVKEKFLPEEHLLKDEITPRVTKYYNFIDEQLKQKVEAENFNENKFRRSVKRVYEDLEAEGIEKTKIFEAISQRFYNIAKDNFTACQILTSYFVQSCEIFREITTEKLEKE